MASLGDGVEVYTSDGPCGAASTQYRGLVMVSKVKSRNAFSDIRCVVRQKVSFSPIKFSYLSILILMI